MFEERISRLESQVGKLNKDVDNMQTMLVSIDKKLGRKNVFDYLVGGVVAASACVVAIVVLL